MTIDEDINQHGKPIPESVDVDPFSVFGETEGERHNEGVVRDPGCGVLAHHDGVERALLHFVRHKLPVDNANGAADTGTSWSAAIGRCTRILDLVDEFCRTRHWMMHVGDEKGLILEEFLIDGLAVWSKGPAGPSSFLILEAGTYCGYSILRMAKTCLQHLRSRNFCIVSCDVSPVYISIADELIRMARLEDLVEFVLLPQATESETSLSDVALSVVQSYRSDAVVDFVFLDHDKELYLKDLCDLERSRLIRAKTRVCADNVVFFRLRDYQDHVKHLADRGAVSTQLRLARLEYVNDGEDEAKSLDLVDGLELTEYLVDPAPLHSIAADSLRNVSMCAER